MYQHVFQTQGVMHFESGKTPRVMRYVVSDDPHWASGYHMHENETELIWVERGTVEVMVNANNTCSCRRHHRLGARQVPYACLK